MDISCNIIRDLLPLYAEDLTSEDSRALVDDHLCGCDACTRQLGLLKKAQAIPVDTEVKSLKRVGDTIRRRRILTVAAALMTAVAIFVTGLIFLFTPYALTAEEAIEGVELREDGGLAIDYASGINGSAGRGIFDVNNYGHICHTNRYDWYKAKQEDKTLEAMGQEELEAYIAKKYNVVECTQKEWDRFFDIRVDYGVWESPDGEHHYSPFIREDTSESECKLISHPAERNHWYLNPATGDVEMLMWDGGQDHPTSIIWTTTGMYGYVMWGSLALAALFCVISRGITGIWQGILSSASIILVCLAVSILLVTGGELTTLEYYLTTEWADRIILEAMVLSVTAMVWHTLCQLKKKETGI